MSKSTRSRYALALAATLTRSTPRVRGLGRACQYIAARATNRWGDHSITMRVSGNLMILDPTERVDRSLIFVPQWTDTGERRACRRILRRGDAAVDVGANIGSYALLFASLVGADGRVAAIEALPEAAEILRRNIRLNGFENISLVEAGVSDRREPATIWMQRKGNRGASTFLPREMDVTGFEAATVDCLPLSDITDGRVRLLKLDIEGLERRVMDQFLSDVQARPDYILTEQWTSEDDAEGVVFLLTRRGYLVEQRFGSNYLLRWPSASTTS